MAELLSSPPSAKTSTQDALAWYKAQYELLTQELSEFQSASKELEAELEKDLDAAEKRERGLRQKVEGLSYEVEEWKRKCKESKSESNTAQSTLEKEITTLRNTNRTLQLKLRDIEVANDDFERQARHTTSSLEDLESKYNVAIERAVLMEEEIKIGEKEREQLRVEAQRFKEELSDLKIEAEILQDKLKRQGSRHHLSNILTDISIPGSPSYINSPRSTASSPIITTPPDTKSQSTAETTSEIQDPPSPPMSDISVPLPKMAMAGFRTPSGLKAPVPPPQRNIRLPSAETTVAPKPRLFATSTSAARTPRASNTSNPTRTVPAHRNSAAARAARAAAQIAAEGAPQSNSLTHIRTLTAQMQKLEARVNSARSKLPAPSSTPPRPSPRNPSSVPPTVTIRSRRRGVGSTASSSATSLVGDQQTPSQSRHGPSDSRSSISTSTSKHVPRLSSSGVSRLSFGPLPNRNPNHQVEDFNTRPDVPRPSSRTSASSYARSASRASLSSGTRTPMGGRPRSSLGGHGHGRGSSQSVGYSTAEVDELAVEADSRTPSRQSTYGRAEMEAVGFSAIPIPRGIPVPKSRRQSGASVSGRRTSGGNRAVLLEDLGETY
ncbi:hypothetical protein BT67DRAFT_440942 [Trichocladium antarcticum]|uniref:NUDE domain-containing protein n=1 Tax=Trichocladium antarcticum TaxID=1450529 RepID=A0AAN6UM47_9PEZI|nr:hypothetical protein BT67DRAFT_440942 [Trichocladium antarcticum]